MKIQISRHGFGPTAALLGAASTLPFPSEHSLPQLSMIGPLPADAVKIAAREYPMGPGAEAVEAIKSVVRGSGRYLYEETFNLSRVLAEQEGVKPDYVRRFLSSEPLHRSVLALTSPSRALVTADPAYEAGPCAASVSGAKVIRIPLTNDYAHDVKAMAAAV